MMKKCIVKKQLKESKKHLPAVILGKAIKEKVVVYPRELQINKQQRRAHT